MAEEKYVNTKGIYSIPYEVVGREDDLKKLKELLTQEKLAVVWGVAGIGKTTLCIKYYKEQKERKTDFVMPFVDLSNCTSIEDFTRAVNHALEVEDIFVELEDIQKWIIKHRYEYDAFFFDNWEDIQTSLAGKRQWDIICDFVNSIKEIGTPVLMSSQEEPPLQWRYVSLGILSDSMGKKLFKNLVRQKGKKIKPSDKCEREALNILLKEMENHPLTIVLTASLIEGKNDSLTRIQKRWSTVYDENAKRRHASMKIALQMSYESVQGTKGAQELWGLIGMLSTDFPEEFIELLSEFEPDILWENARRKLYKRRLITHSQTGKIHMLNTVKMQWENLAGKKLTKKCIKMWGGFLAYVVEQSDAPHFTHNPQKANLLRKPVLFCMPGFMRIVERLIGENEIQIAERCINAMGDYYELVGGRALAFLKNLPLEKLTDHTRGMINKWIGDISRLGKKEQPEIALGCYKEALKWLESDGNAKAEVLNNIGQNYLWSYQNPGKAMDYFKEAEEALPEKRSDKVLAMILKNRGIVLAEWYERYDLAKNCYDEAEKLYCRIGDYRGIAHTIKRKGVIEWKKTHYQYAVDQFKKAIKYYRAVHYIQGQADSMARMCYSYIKMEDEEELKRLIKEGEKLMEVIPYQITKTDLINSIAKAKEWLKEHDDEKNGIIDQNSPMKWIKHMVLCYFELRNREELQGTIRRFSISNCEKCLEEIREKLQKKENSVYVVKMVYQSRFYKLPNYIISSEEELIQCKKKIQESSKGKFAQIWYCENKSSDIRAYGRVLLTLNEVSSTRSKRKIEIVWAKSARMLEQYPAISCPFIAITTRGWGMDYEIDDLMLGTKTKEEIIAEVDEILDRLPKYYRKIVELGDYLRENGCSYLCVEFSFLKSVEFSIIDWDSDNDEKVLKAFKKMQAAIKFMKEEV